MDASDCHAVCVVARNLSNRAVTAWYRAKAKINLLFRNSPSRGCSAHESIWYLPYEIMELIVDYITYPTTLIAFSLTCRSWYIVAAPRLYHTLTLERRKASNIFRGKERPLSRLRGHPIPLAVREIWMRQREVSWFDPREIGRRELRNFSAFANVQTLKIQRLDIDRFMPDIERYFRHFSQTLRSITLLKPYCTPRQLSYFLSLFSNLDDVEIRIGGMPLPESDPEHVPFSTPKLRGRLELDAFPWVEVWTYLIASCGGLQFHYMNLCMSKKCAPILLGACANTLETLRLSAMDLSVGKWFSMSLLTGSS